MAAKKMKKKVEKEDIDDIDDIGDDISPTDIEEDIDDDTTEEADSDF